MRNVRWIILAAATMALFISAGAMAQTGFGLRAGATVDPDQFHFGAHFASDPFVDKLTFRPNFEAGVGSDITGLALNFEFAYKVPLSQSQYSAYFGAGPAINVFRYSGDTDARGGFNFLLGLEHKRGFFGELKIGAWDSPDFKLTVGYTFQ